MYEAAASVDADLLLADIDVPPGIADGGPDDLGPGDLGPGDDGPGDDGPESWAAAEQAGVDAALAAMAAAEYGDGRVGGETLGPDLAARLRRAIAEPGHPAVAGWLAVLDADRLDLHHRVLLARAWEGQRRRVEACYQQVLAACLGPEPVEDRPEGGTAKAGTVPPAGTVIGSPGGWLPATVDAVAATAADLLTASTPTTGTADSIATAVGDLAAAHLTPADGTADIAGGQATGAAGVGLAAYARVEETRLALALSPGQLHAAATTARALAGAYRPARDALAAGRIAVPQVRDLLQATRTVPGPALPGLLARVLPRAGDQTGGAWRATLRRAVTSAAPAAAAAGLATAHAERSAQLRDEDSEVTDTTGQRVVTTTELTARTDPVQARRIAVLVEGHARRLRAAARRAAAVELAAASTAHTAARQTLRAALAAARRGTTDHAGEPGDRGTSAAAAGGLDRPGVPGVPDGSGARGVPGGPGEGLPTGVAAARAALTAAAAALAAARAEHARVHAQRLGAWRVDALEDLLAAGARAVHGPGGLRAHARPVELVVAVDLDTALALAGHPVELRGYGALPPAALAELSTAARGWLLTLTRTDGAPLAVTRYRPGAALQDWITATRPTCTAPHCPTPVAWCQRDHTAPYHHADPTAGGHTSAANLHPLCVGHHQLKTHAGYHTAAHPDGSITTRTPAGHTYRTPPPQVVPTAGLVPRPAPPPDPVEPAAAPPGEPPGAAAPSETPPRDRAADDVPPF